MFGMTARDWMRDTAVFETWVPCSTGQAIQILKCLSVSEPQALIGTKSTLKHSIVLLPPSLLIFLASEPTSKNIDGVKLSQVRQVLNRSLPGLLFDVPPGH